jgi:hypothetical protein
LLRVDEPDLEQDPGVWEDVWRANRDELLSWWIGRHPGDRPEAWWRFDAAEVMQPRTT